MEQIPHHQSTKHVTDDIKSGTTEGDSDSIIVSAKFLKLFGTLFFVVVVFGGALSYFKNKLDDIPKNYDECVKRTGSRLQKSQPSICITLEGNYFIQPLVDQNGTPIYKTPTPVTRDSAPAPTFVIVTSIPTPLAPKACKRTGCSGQFCVDINAEDIITTCEYRAEYACYQEAPCERQSNGQCGFTPSNALNTCIQKAVSNSAIPLQ